jgi:hypothetical protein
MQQMREELVDGIAIPLRLSTPGGILSLISTVTVFGTPLEITLSELTMEAFTPLMSLRKRPYRVSGNDLERVYVRWNSFSFIFFCRGPACSDARSGDLIRARPNAEWRQGGGHAFCARNVCRRSVARGGGRLRTIGDPGGLGDCVSNRSICWSGLSYLIYLGITIIRTRHIDPDFGNAVPRARRPLVQGIVTEILNPKTALFFLSFIPQFVAVDRGHTAWQFLTLGVISVALNTAVDLVVVLCAAAIAQRIGRSNTFHTRQRTVSGASMIGVGVYTAVVDAH